MGYETEVDKQVLIGRILELKVRKKAVILSHNYQIPEIQDLADFLGDSLELAKKSLEIESPLVVLCGVRFMAETVKILSADKRVILPSPDAGCPLADTIKPNQLKELKEKYPGAWVVSYVNTSAEIKALSDVCCTSANAVEVVKNVPSKKVIFVPDKNLGWWVKHNVSQKEIIVSEGFCYVHEQINLNDLKQAKKSHPFAQVLVHPECKKEILEKADYVLSTSGMLKRVKESQVREFIVGTEASFLYRLEKDNPQKDFYLLCGTSICRDMKKTSLEELYRALQEEVYEIKLDGNIIAGARKALEIMVRYI